MFHHFLLGGVSVPSYQIFNTTPSVNNLNPSLTVNGITETPMFQYKGGDASASGFPAWTYGDSLNATGSGGTFNAGSVLMESNDDSWLGSATRYFQSANGALNDITTEDFVFECLIKPNETGETYFSKAALTTDAGYRLRNTSGAFLFSIIDGSANTATATSGSIGTSSWTHIIVFCDKSEASTNGMRMYVNGVDNGNANPSAVGSLTTSQLFTIGARSAGVSPIQGNMAYCAMWKRDSWLNNSSLTEVAAIAKERFTRMVGAYPSAYAGTAIPTTITRNSPAYLDKVNAVTGVVTLYKVNNHWPRIATWRDSSSDDITGYLCELAATNLCLQSEVFGTTWTVVDAGDTISSNAIAAPDQLVTADGVIGDATDGQHGVSQNITVTATRYCFSVYAKAGNQNHLYMEDITIANAFSYFNLSAGVVGTVGAGVAEQFIVPMGNGWYRCGFSFTGTAAAHTFRISPASADNDNTFSGDSVTINTYLWAAQVELGRLPTSYIKTLTGQVTRPVDIFKVTYTGNANEVKGSGVAKVLIREYDANAELTVFSISTTDQTNMVQLRILELTDDVGVVAINSGGAIQAIVEGTTKITDGVIKTLAANWDTNLAVLYVDGIEEGTRDTSVTPSTGATEIAIGCDGGSSSQINGIISNLRIYPSIGKIE